MDFVTRIRQSWGFTRTEIVAIAFISVPFLIGIGLRLLGNGQTPEAQQQFDYSTSDSMFAVLSAAPTLSADTGNIAPPLAREPLLPKPASVNINTAGKSDLMRLPGIGEAYAERIILCREDAGPFTRPEDLLKVKGIGKKKLERIRPYIVVR